MEMGCIPERGCVEDQPQRVRTADVLRLALRTQPRSHRQLVDALLRIPQGWRALTPDRRACYCWNTVRAPLNRLLCFLLILSALPLAADGEDFTNALQAFLQDRVEETKANMGIVVGIVDEHRSFTVSYGKADNETTAEVNGDTIFEIGSITKAFTALLLQDSVERGEMKLDDPVSNSLPESVKMPSRNGKEITLLELATHMSGLPRDPDNAEPQRADNPWADYTEEQLYDFLSNYRLPRDPGEKWEYSNLGFGLLGYAIALKAGSDYETLVVNRICEPLQMNDTRITWTPEMKARLARGHSARGEPVGRMNFQTLLGNGALCSSANDMLKFLGANLSLPKSELTPIMAKTHIARAPNQALGWEITASIVWKNGGTFGCRTFAGVDLKRRRAVIVLANMQLGDEIDDMGFLVLRSEWDTQKRTSVLKESPRTCAAYVGQYRFGTNLVIGIRYKGDRLFIQRAGRIVGELVPESRTCFFDRLRGKDDQRLTFICGEDGQVTDANYTENEVVSPGIKVSDQPPALSKRPKRRIIVKLNPDVYDAYVGTYEFSSNAAIQFGWKVPTLCVRRDGNILLGQVAGIGAAELCPESKTTFFLKEADVQFTFVKNQSGKATSVIAHVKGHDYEAKRIPLPSP